MNFTIKKDALTDDLNNVGKALSNKIQMPGLTGILFNVYKDKLILTASNNEISIQATITKDFKVVEEGSFLLQGKFLLEIIKKIDSEYVDFISFEDNTIRILGGKSVFTLNCLQLESFPMISFEKSTINFALDTINLKQIITKTSFAISTNESRVILTGVSFKTKGNTLEVISSDGFRLARKKLEFDHDFPAVNMVIPGKNLDDLYKILGETNENIQIYCSSSKIMFEIGNLLYQSRLIEGVFPNVDSLIPKNYMNILTFNKQALIDLIERVSIFVTNEASKVIKLSIAEGNVVEFSSLTNEAGAAREEINPIKMDNQSTFQIGFSSKYFIEALRTFDDDVISINFTGEVKPFTITSEKDKNLLQLILPVRA